MSSIFRRNVSQKNVGGHPGDEQKRRVSSTHRQEPTESSCSTEYDPGLCLSQNTGLTSGILRRKVTNGDSCRNSKRFPSQRHNKCRQPTRIPPAPSSSIENTCNRVLVPVRAPAAGGSSIQSNRSKRPLAKRPNPDVPPTQTSPRAV